MKVTGWLLLILGCAQSVLASIHYHAESIEPLPSGWFPAGFNDRGSIGGVIILDADGKKHQLGFFKGIEQETLYFEGPSEEEKERVVWLYYGRLNQNDEMVFRDGSKLGTFTWDESDGARPVDYEVDTRTTVQAKGITNHREIVAQYQRTQGNEIDHGVMIWSAPGQVEEVSLKQAFKEIDVHFEVRKGVASLAEVNSQDQYLFAIYSKPPCWNTFAIWDNAAGRFITPADHDEKILGKAFNDWGQVAGQVLQDDHHPSFFWSEEDGFVRLEKFVSESYPDGLIPSQVEDMNNAGQVIGMLTAPKKRDEETSGGDLYRDFQQRPFLWDKEQGTMDLSTLLDEESASYLSVRRAYRINNLGQILASGFDQDQQMPVYFILTPCEVEDDFDDNDEG